VTRTRVAGREYRLTYRHTPTSYAGIVFRGVAAIIDIIIFVLLMLIPLFVYLFLTRLTLRTSGYLVQQNYPLILDVFSGIFFITANWLYNAGFESSRYMGTPGKRICGLKVTDLEGEQISLGQATIRYAFKSGFSLLVSQLGGYISCLVDLYNVANILTMYTNARRQCIHDMIAGTMVVHMSKDSPPGRRGSPRKPGSHLGTPIQ